MSKLIWKPYPKNKKLEVSTDGNVRVAEENIKLVDGNTRYVPPRILPPKPYGRYLYVNFDSKTYSIGRLVAETYIDAHDSKDKVVLYRSDNTFDNDVSNLFWGTRKEAMKKSLTSKKYRKSSGRSIKIICRETNEIFQSVKECVHHINIRSEIPVNYDTFLRRLKKQSIIKISDKHYERIIS